MLGAIHDYHTNNMMQTSIAAIVVAMVGATTAAQPAAYLCTGENFTGDCQVLPAGFNNTCQILPAPFYKNVGAFSPNSDGVVCEIT
jgi:hypothetical protein